MGKILRFFQNTTVQDAPGGAENTRCNSNKRQLCLGGNYRHIFGSWFSDVNGLQTVGSERPDVEVL